MLKGFIHFPMQIKVVSALLFAAVAGQLTATEVVTTSYSAWTATLNANAPAEWDFSFANGTAYSTAAGYTLNAGSYGPLTVTGPDGAGYSLTENTSYFDSTTSQTITTLESAGDGVGSMLFTTPASGLTAFGLGLGMVGAANPVTVTLSDGETFGVSPGIDGDAFLGFSSTTPITSFTLTTASGSNIELTDFDAGDASQPAPAAEVTPFAMIGSGLLFFLARRRILQGLPHTQS
jgi:hypothetical protein